MPWSDQLTLSVGVCRCVRRWCAGKSPDGAVNTLVVDNPIDRLVERTLWAVCLTSFTSIADDGYLIVNAVVDVRPVLESGLNDSHSVVVDDVEIRRLFEKLQPLLRVTIEDGECAKRKCFKDRLLPHIPQCRQRGYNQRTLYSPLFA